MSTGKYAGTYTTYSINENAFEFYQNYVLEGVVSKNGFLGMYKIPEGKEGAGTIKQYTHDGTTVTYVSQSDSNLAMYWQLYRSSNWLGFAGADSVYKVDFLPLWNLSSIGSVSNGTSKYTAISYTLYNQTLAKEFALTAFNYDDFGDYTLEGMTATLYDDKSDGNYDYVYIDLMISGDGVNSLGAIYNRMLIDLKTVGKTTITVADSEIAKIKDASTAA